MHGFVRSPCGPVPGVAVSNGHDSAVTREDGSYSLPDRGNFVFVSTPATFTTDRWWKRTSSERADFDLTPRDHRDDFTFIHLTDTHISDSSFDQPDFLYEQGGTPEQLADFLANVPTQHPDADAIFITGDLVDNGLPEEFAKFIEIIQDSPVEVRVIPGNHDHMNGDPQPIVSKNNYHTHTGDPTTYEEFLGPRWFSFNIPGLHVVALDWLTHELGIDDTEQEAWLRSDLALLPEGMPWALLFHDQPGDSLLANVPRLPVAAFSGHWHTSRVIRVDDVLHVNTPPAFFGGLDYSPTMTRLVTWDGSEFHLDTRTTSAHTFKEAPPALRKATIASGKSTGSDSLVWYTPLSGAGQHQSVVIDGEQGFVSTQREDTPGGSVESLDLITGKTIWSVPTPAAVKASVAVAGDIVVSHEVTGDVQGFSKTTGERLWHSPSKDPLRRFGWAAPATDGHYIVVGDQADLRCLNAETGETIWRRTDLAPHTNHVNHAAPLIIDDRVIVGYYPNPQYPIGLDLHTGKDLWERSSETMNLTYPELKNLLAMGTATYDEETNSVLLPAFGRTLCLDAQTGKLKWTTPHAGTFGPAAPVVTDAGIAVTAGDRGIEFLNRFDGHKLWDLHLPETAPFPFHPYTKNPGVALARPTLVDDLLILPGLDGVIRSISLQGEQAGSMDLGVPVASPLEHAGNKLYGIGVDGGVFALNQAGLQ